MVSGQIDVKFRFLQKDRGPDSANRAYLKPSPNGYGRVAIVAIWIVEPRGCNCRIRCARCGLLRLSLTGIKRA